MKKILSLSLLILSFLLINPNLVFAQTVTGSGTVNFHPKFTDTSTIGNSSLFDNGNVGIGTTNPLGFFHVEKSNYTNNQVVLSNGLTGSIPNYTGGYQPTLVVRSAEQNGSRPLWFGYQTGSSWDGFVVFGACNSFSWMCLDFGDGSNIYSAFQSAGSTLWIGGHTFSADGDYSTINLGYTSTATTLNIGNTTGATAVKIGTGTGNFSVNNNQLYLQKSSGNVGIGTSSPGQILDVVGGNGRVQSGYNWLTNSDVKFKTNITELSGALEKVSNLRGVRYDLKNASEIILGQGKQVGFIAQELEKQYPELVVTEDNGTKSVAYDKMTAVLVEAIKEQQQQIDQLKEEVRLLKQIAK